MKVYLKKKSLGFTLIELLAVVAVLGVVGSILFSVLFTTLRGSNRSDSLGLVSQNGKSALSQVTKMIQYAKSLEVPTTCYINDSETSVATDSVKIRNFDNNITEFSCQNNTISSNSASLLDTSQVRTTSCSFTCTQETAYDTPTITVSFTVAKVGENLLFENSATLPFETTVSLRNSQ